MRSAAKPAGTAEQYQSFPGRHYYPSAEHDAFGGKSLKVSPRLLIWAGAALALHVVMRLFGL